MRAWPAIEPAIPPRGRGPLRWRGRIGPTVAKHAVDWPAWGYRKIRAIAGVDGHDVGSASSVRRAMARRGLLQPVRYQAERRQLAQACREVFVEPPVRRNRVWQVDFSAFETTTEGTWQLGGVVDYAAKVALACPVTVTQTAADLLAALHAAIDAAEALLGCRLAEDCVDAVTGEIVPIAVVTDTHTGGASLGLGGSDSLTDWLRALPLNCRPAPGRGARTDRSGGRDLIAPLCQVAAFWRVRSASARRVR